MRIFISGLLAIGNWQLDAFQKIGSSESNLASDQLPVASCPLPHVTALGNSTLNLVRPSLVRSAATVPA
jgi:hypothetical protein